MSILSSLYHDRIRDKPNDVHNEPQTPGTAGTPEINPQPRRSTPDSPSMAHAQNGAQPCGCDPCGETTDDCGCGPRGKAPDDCGCDPCGETPDDCGCGPKSRACGGAKESTDGSAVMDSEARRRMAAEEEGHLRPALYYTAQEQTPCASGVWEDPHTVASKLESKEEYPQG